MPVAQGGTDTLENLVTLCVDCHHEAHRNGRRDGKPGGKRAVEATLLIY